LLGRIAGGDPLAGLLPAVKAVVPGWSKPIGQNRESLPARGTPSATRTNALVLVVVGLAEALTMADDRVVPADWTSPWEQIQGDHPGSVPSFVSGNAIKRITAGVKAPVANSPRQD
jgi:hypothetical protein